MSRRLPKASLFESPGTTQLGVIEGGLELDPQKISYQHTVFCQTSLPYRDQKDATEWQRVNGNIRLLMSCKKVWNPDTDDFQTLGIPFGAKPRLIISDINTKAILTKSPLIDIEKTMCEYIQRLGIDKTGRNIHTVKDQLARLCGTIFQLVITDGDRFEQIDTQIVRHMSMWSQKENGRKVLWPQSMELSGDYFNMLADHAVPLDNEQYFSLAHSAMAMDLYAWLAQRLHRIHKQSDVRVSWHQLQLQFGWEYNRIEHFRAKFKVALDQVLSAYKDARVQIEPAGIVLRNSPPPVSKRISVALTP
jgi:hypothetical protein